MLDNSKCHSEQFMTNYLGYYEAPMKFVTFGFERRPNVLLMRDCLLLSTPSPPFCFRLFEINLFRF